MNLRIGLSALQASQYAIQNISHNLANAGTEGYHRQDVVFQTARADFVRGRYVGSGVQVSDVRRMRDMIVEGAFTNSIADLSRVEQSLLIESRIEALIAPGEGSIQNSFTGLFDEFSRLSANPGERSLRSSVLNQASNLATRIQGVSSQFVDIQEDVRHQINIEVEALNRDVEDLVDLQNRIKSSGNGPSNDLLDQRDQLINKIAERVDVQRFEFVRDDLSLGLAGSSVSIGTSAVRFEAVQLDDGQMEIRVEKRG